MSKLNKICDLLLETTEQDFTNAEKLANECVNYSHPFRLERAAKIQNEGKHDLLILEKMKELKTLIQEKPHRDKI
jgi:hypothetical protein